ncbi:hypothetical protein TNCV_3924911 [Trichonephila clavipes]|nr:hypothetical protein TNCV_3924911 [Trichonephila clavipes]
MKFSKIPVEVKFFRGLFLHLPKILKEKDVLMLLIILEYIASSVGCAPRAQYFHRLYVTFSNCSTICGGLFWSRIKLFWIPLFGFNHFEPPKTQQLVSEVGLNANNKSDGGPVPDSSRKIDRQHECQYGRNEIGVDRHECQYGRVEYQAYQRKRADQRQQRRS